MSMNSLKILYFSEEHWTVLLNTHFNKIKLQFLKWNNKDNTFNNKISQNKVKNWIALSKIIKFRYKEM